MLHLRKPSRVGFTAETACGGQWQVARSGISMAIRQLAVTLPSLIDLFLFHRNSRLAAPSSRTTSTTISVSPSGNTGNSSVRNAVT